MTVSAIQECVYDPLPVTCPTGGQAAGTDQAVGEEVETVCLGAGAPQ